MKKAKSEVFESPRKYGRKGLYNGLTCLFTHRDPNTGKVWSDDLCEGKGKWVWPEHIKWLEGATS